MTPRPRRRPSPALLVSILALVMAMGGSSIAQDVVADISAKIKGKRIAKNAIKSKHIANGKVKAVDLAPGVIPAPLDAYTKAESDGKYLAAGGKAADSELLDGKDSTEFLGKTEKAADSDTVDGVDASDLVRTGGANKAGRLDFARRTLPDADAAPTFLELPGLGTLALTCDAVGQVGLNFTTATSLDIADDIAADAYSSLGSGANTILLPAGGGVNSGQIMIGRSSIFGSRQVQVAVIAEGRGDGNGCRAMATASDQSSSTVALTP